MQSVLISAITNPTTIEAVKGKISDQVARLPPNRVGPFSTAWSHLNDAVNMGVQKAKTNPAPTPATAPVPPAMGGRRKRKQTRKLKRKVRK